MIRTIGGPSPARQPDRLATTVTRESVRYLFNLRGRSGTIYSRARRKGPLLWETRHLAALADQRPTPAPRRLTPPLEWWEVATWLGRR